MRRLPILGLALVLVATLLAGASAVAAAPAAPDQGADPGRLSIVEIEGLIDPVVADFIEESIAAGERSGVIAVVLQMDSAGSVVDDERLAELARTIHDAKVPVTVWVGPAGSSALGGAAQLAGAADLLGLAPGSRLGKTGDLVVPEDLLSNGFLAAGERLEGGTVNDEDARNLEIAPDRRVAVIGEFIIDLDGVETRTVTVEGKPQREPISVPVFSVMVWIVFENSI